MRQATTNRLPTHRQAGGGEREKPARMVYRKVFSVHQLLLLLSIFAVLRAPSAASFPTHSPGPATTSSSVVLWSTRNNNGGSGKAPKMLLASSNKVRPLFRPRRIFIRTIPGLLFLLPSSSHAEPLGMSKLLQPLRIVTQNSADIALYNGELVDPMSSEGQPGSNASLVSLLNLLNSLSLLSESVLSNPASTSSGLSLFSSLGFGSPLVVAKMKRVFNQYSDNIFYGPYSERSNAYLLGGATPSSRQSLLYLLRNDIIEAAQDLEAELKFVDRGGEDGEVVKAARILKERVENMRKVLPSMPPMPEKG